MTNLTEATGPSGRPRVVAVDFGSIGDGVPLADLLPKTDSEITVIDPLDWSWDTGPQALAANAAAAAQQLRAHAVPPRLLIAQCTGTAFGLTLAASMAAGTALAAVVLVEPVVVTAQVLGAQAHRLIARLGADPGPTTRRNAAARATDPADLATYLRPLLRSAAQRRAGQRHLEADEAALVVDAIVERYLCWMSFLSSQIGPRSVDLECPIHVLAAPGGDWSPGDWLPGVRSLAGSAPVNVVHIAPDAPRSALREHIAGILAGRRHREAIADGR